MTLSPETLLPTDASKFLLELEELSNTIWKFITQLVNAEVLFDPLSSERLAFPQSTMRNETTAAENSNLSLV